MALRTGIRPLLAPAEVQDRAGDDHEGLTDERSPSCCSSSTRRKRASACRRLQGVRLAVHRHFYDLLNDVDKGEGTDVTEWRIARRPRVWCATNWRGPYSARMQPNRLFAARPNMYPQRPSARRQAVRKEVDASAGTRGLGQLESLVPGCPGVGQTTGDSKKGLRSKPQADDWQHGAIATLVQAMSVTHESQVPSL
jgi:hypothetical protein